jgi:methionyl-tRNA synthetase
MKKFYITAAIPYVNAAPHLGHALEFVQCDAIARYHRLLGKKTTLLTGADENSLKNVAAAEKLGIPTQKLCDENSRKFQQLIKVLNTSFDIFQRSTSKDHVLGSQNLWQLCDANGDIYKKQYTGLYCVGCEAFYTKEELTTDGLCPEHLTKPQEISEENYFFRLSKYQKQLENLIKTDRLKIIPETRKNEVLSFIKMGLTDFSISRSKTRAKDWGVRIVDSRNQIMYVWFDALNVYQTGIGFGWNDALYKKWWPANVHVIGKGIIRFHAIYWPAILLSAHLPLPLSVFAHGYITIEGQKMSKTLGNIIDPFYLVEKYGADTIRYYLLREIPAYTDGDFSQQRLKELYNADLANGLGNLAARLAKLAENNKYRGSNHQLADKYQNVIKKSKQYKKALEEYRFNDAVAFVWQQITNANKKIDKTKPWTLTGEKLTKILKPLIKQILEMAMLLQPFLPQTSETILKQFSGPKIESQPPLFPRIK